MGSDGPANSAVQSAKGTVYQLCVAIEACFRMTENQRVLFEIEGDVTSVSDQTAPEIHPEDILTEGTKQIEVKAHADSLTDGHVNFWKSLKNWLAIHEHHEKYSALVLLTTQDCPGTSFFSRWNRESPENRRAFILEQCQMSGAVPEPEKPIKASSIQAIRAEIFRQANESYFMPVVSKLIIESASPTLPEMTSLIKQRWLKGILEKKKDDVIQALVGFIAQPGNSGRETWDITYEDFTKKYQSLVSEYSQQTVTFPRTRQAAIPLPSEVADRDASLFIGKIRDIELSKFIPVAVADFAHAKYLIFSELGNYDVPKERITGYFEETIDKYESEYHAASLTCKAVIRDSQVHYHRVMAASAEPLERFQAVDRRFKNGIIHMAMDEAERDLKWKLGT